MSVDLNKTENKAPDTPKLNYDSNYTLNDDVKNSNQSRDFPFETKEFMNFLSNRF